MHRPIVDRGGRFVPGVDSVEVGVLSKTLGLMSRDDGGEDVSDEASRKSVAAFFIGQEATAPTPNSVGRIVLTARLIMNMDIPSPFNIE